MQTQTTTPSAQALPKLPRMKRTPKAKTNDCACGCGEKTARRFAPGHDSKLHARVLRIAAGMDLSAILSPSELEAATKAATHGPRLAEPVVEPKKTKKALKEEARQAKIAAQLASINKADAA